MKYFIDTEFLEGKQDKRLFNIKYGETKPTIDLISIGIVAEDGCEYYAFSNEFNLNEAWNRHDVIEANTAKNHSQYDIKVYWIRDNVLMPIFFDLAKEDFYSTHFKDEWPYDQSPIKFKKNFGSDFKWFKKLVKKYGKSNKQISNEIIQFTDSHKVRTILHSELDIPNREQIEFYGYYSDYDWVVFCWIFGKMMNLPKGYPMYCIDLKQTLDEKANQVSMYNISGGLKSIKMSMGYPKEQNEHNALSDAHWNRKLYEFLTRMKITP